MIKDPKPFMWKPILTMNQFVKKKHPFCQYSKQYWLPCARNNDIKECKNCYMHQVWQTDLYNRKNPHRAVTHICDRCGKEIDRVDHVVYITLRDRLGKKIETLELCEFCIADFVGWVDVDINITDADEDELNYEQELLHIWGVGKRE